VISAVLLLPLLGCDAPPPEPSQASATVSATASATAAVSTKPTKPKIKATTSPPRDKLGTLPEGVGIAVGELAPAFKLKDQHGKEVTLESLLSYRDVLLVFYRGGW
jgi:hypothetical protein